MRSALLVGSLALLWVPAAGAGDKVAVQWDCATPDPNHMLETGDQPNHFYSISRVKCTATKGEIAGVKQQTGVSTEFHEVKGTADQFHGVFVETLANGDKITYTYEGKATIEGGKLKSAANTWSATSGTGDFKSIKASGKCTAAPKADGGAMFDCSGDYSIAK